MTFLKGQNPQGGPARRGVIAGVAVAGAAVAAGLYRFTDLFVKHYTPTPYDDVLAALADREQAVRFGALVPGNLDAKGLAARLRPMLTSGGLGEVANADIAADRLVEVGGWVVPQSVALTSALAAKTYPGLAAINPRSELPK
jgi:hypothetical protein